ncbi:MAG: hypothetical protein R3E54_00920 [Halioglobus sp.]
MLRLIPSCCLAAPLTALVACGGGGGNSASGVNPGPPWLGGPVDPPTPEFPNTNPAPYADAEALFAFINSAELNAEEQPVVTFQLTDGAHACRLPTSRWKTCAS